MSDINGVYCDNCECEYSDEGDCCYEGSLKLDEHGTCQKFRYTDLTE